MSLLSQVFRTKPSRPKNAHVIYLQFGDKYQEAGLAKLNYFCQRVLPGINTNFVIVDNQELETTHKQIHSRCTLIGGNNSCREFSGYDRGVAWLNKIKSHDDDLVIIANDTFFRSYGEEYLNLFNQENVSQEAYQKGSLMGWFDAFPKKVALDGTFFQRWIRSSFYVTNLKTINKLLRLSCPWSNEELFSMSLEPFFKKDCPLDLRYQSYLEKWLFNKANSDIEKEFPNTWHSSATLTEKNLRDFQEKARCIVAEHSVTLRAFNAGIPIFSVRDQTTFQESGGLLWES